MGIFTVGYHRIAEQMYRVKKLSIVLAVLLSLVFWVAGCQSSSTVQTEQEKQTRPLVYVAWGGALQEDEEAVWVKPFTEQAGIQYLLDTCDYGKFKAMVESGNVEWDVVKVDRNWLELAARQGLLEPLDYEIIDTTGIPPEFVHEYGVYVSSYSTILAWNTDLVDGTPTGWADFWDVEMFPGPRTLYGDEPVATIEIALIADGMPLEEIYPLTDEKIERAFAKLDEIKPYIQVWWSSGAEGAQVIADGTVAFGTPWSGRIIGIMNEGAPVDFTYNQGILDFMAFVVPKGSPNKELAMQLINYAISPKAQAEFCEIQPYGPSNSLAFDYLDDEHAKLLNTYPEYLTTQLLLSTQWGDAWREETDIDRLFLEWIME